ncbi:hypothetical protein [Haloactinospora alba]|uniref:hypothetical protein n=1 Tax=Haloactinospora alba TaxID=405555 RepID=UPI0011540335|nr:hypothetical protein [Haloactinospora alba]
MSTAGDDAIEVATMAGLDLDPWQKLTLREALGEQEETFYNELLGQHQRKWASFEVGQVVSRQNGKGGVIEARELAGLFAFGERVLIHTAHQFDTSAEAFTRILTLIENTPEFDAQVKKVSHSHGKEGIFLKSGQRLLFKARSKGGGRGFSGDVVFLDEAMFLPPEVMAALMPTLSARPNPQIWYLGSAGNKESIQLGRVRNRALAGGDPSLCYLEWSANACGQLCPEECEDHDRRDAPETWARANPALGIRISVDYVRNEFRSLGHAEFDQERLGVGDWPSEGEGWQVIPEDAWTALVDPGSQPRNPVCFSLDVNPERSMGAIGVAGVRPDGLYHVEVVDHLPGVTWMVPRALELIEKWKPAAVVVGNFGPAASLIPDLEAKDVTVIKASMNERAAAAGGFVDACVRPSSAPDGWRSTVRHLDQGSLTGAVSSATAHQVGRDGAFVWGRDTPSSDISPLVAASQALWGYRKFGRKESPKPFALVGSS